MIFQHRAHRAPVVLVVVTSLLFLPACLFSPSKGGGGGGGTQEAPPRTSVDGAIKLFAFVWQNKRLDLYEQLLADAFEFVPQQTDAEDLPWVTPETPWVRSDELGMAKNMFDSNFVSQETGHSVQSIDMNLEITNEVAVPEGVDVTTHAVIQVLWDTSTGASSDVRFVFTVIPDPDEPGLFQILRQVELPLF